MRRLMSVLLLVCAGCSADWVPFSGGAIQGQAVPLPSDWTETASPEVIELETFVDEPYSVKLWIIGMGPLLYVHAGANRATWIEHIEVNPDVRVGIDGDIYELTAVRVLDQAEFDRFADVYEVKYGNRPRNENVQEAYLMRLEPRG